MERKNKSQLTRRWSRSLTLRLNFSLCEEQEMKILIVVAILVFLYWFFILRPGRLDFWKIANKYPDETYDLFISEDCWKVVEESLADDHQSIVPKKDWTGPFRLRV